MKNYFVILLIIFSIIVIFPAANAQNLAEGSNQKSIRVTISPIGEMHATHVIQTLNESIEIKLIDGTISNLVIKDEEGNDVEFTELIDNSIILPPSRSEIIIDYDLSDILFKKGNIWTLEFLYLESTSFIFPEEVDLIFVNNNPAYLGDKNGILCHGCQMILEYTFNEPKNIEKIKTQDDEFLIEILSWNNINQFSFNSIDRINFKVNMENNFVTTIIPTNFLAEPYQVLLNEEDIKFHKNFNNETHVWLNFKPQSSGDISIVGTLVPEIIIPEEPLDQTGIIVIGIIIVGLVIAGVFFYKRKK